jgi:glycosyltransferase involved in cell wall biosynthesis
MNGPKDYALTVSVLFIQPYISFFGVISDTLPGQLARRGHDVVVMTYAREEGKTNLFSLEEEVHLEVVDALSISIPGLVTEFPYFLYLENRIKQIQPEFVHINNIAFLTTLQSVKIATKLHMKSIVHIHGVMGDRGRLSNLFQRLYIGAFGPYIFNKANELICLTIHDAETIERWGCPPEKIHVIPNGVDVDKFRPSGEEQPNLLLWCGRFIEQKGLKYLMEAFEIIVREKQHSQAKLALIGDGPLFPKIYELARKYRITDNIFFKGRLPRRRIPAIMNKASVYVLPSLREGMPYVLLEAMACGKAVVGSDIPGINDVITHMKNGILVPPRDSQSLAQAVLTLLDDEKLRRKIGQKARELMVEKYSWDKITSRIEKVYHETMKA